MRHKIETHKALLDTTDTDYLVKLIGSPIRKFWDYLHGGQEEFVTSRKH